jgi:hypothetical protein
MNFKDIYDEILENKKNHEDGYYNCIPFIGMERLEKYLVGIEQDTYYLLTASSGVGKSKLARYLFIHNPYQFIVNNPDTDIKLTIKYFSLEESKKKIILSEISKYLYTKYNLNISIKKLQSRGRYNTIDSNILEKIIEAEEYVNKFLKVVDIIDNISNPTGIYKYVRDFALTVGTYYTKDNIPLSIEEIEKVKRGEGDIFKKIAYYKKHNSKHYVIIIVDHISLLTPENGSTLWQAMSDYSSKYCINFRNKFGFIPVVIQQQASAKEQVEYNYKGNSIEEKLEPSLDSLGDNKTTQRDANIVIALFAPDRYGIQNHNGYNIRILRDRYRSLSILKDRDGVSNMKLPLFFNGAVDFFKELPKPDDLENIRKVYEYVSELNNLN